MAETNKRKRKRPTMKRKTNLFVSFEGLDGSGKSTQIDLLTSYLKEKGLDVVNTREPGGTKISEKIREIILDTENAEMFDETEAFLYAASRVQHVGQVIKPSLDAGKTVICDRFLDSSIAYQGYGRELGKMVEEINEFAIKGCKPDLTFLLIVPPEEGRKRATNRDKLDRLESEALDFHYRVYGGYVELAEKEPKRFVIIDASKSIEEIQSIIKTEIDKRM